MSVCKEPFVQNLRQLNKDAADAFGNQTIDFVSYEKQITDSYNSVRVFRNATLMAAVTMFFVMLMGLIGYTADEVRRRGKGDCHPQRSTVRKRPLSWNCFPKTCLS